MLVNAPSNARPERRLRCALPACKFARPRRSWRLPPRARGIRPAAAGGAARNHHPPRLYRKRAMGGIPKSAEASDGLPDPLDRWSQRVIGSIASELPRWPSIQADPLPRYPFKGLRPAANLCTEVRSVCSSIHSGGSGTPIAAHSFVLPDRISLPRLAPAASPCSACATQPCLSSCPVQAFRSGSFHLELCLDHVLSAAGSECRERGCRARRACPVGADYRYIEAQARFHMLAFLRSARPRSSS